MHTFLLRPRRKEAAVRCAKRLYALGGASLVVTFFQDYAEFSEEKSAKTIATLAGFAIAGAVLYSISEMWGVWTAQAQYALAIDTSGPSTAVVTGRDFRVLSQLVGQITHAIENPETELVAQVQTLTINPKYYYLGDNVNIYGGTGNVGIST